MAAIRHNRKQALPTVGESETHFVETNCRIRCMDLMGSILCQYYRTFWNFPNHVVHAAFVQRVSQKSCNVLACYEISLAVQQLHQSGSDTNQRSWTTLIHADWDIARATMKWHLWQCTLRKCYAVWLTGQYWLEYTQHSPTVVSWLVA